MTRALDINLHDTSVGIWQDDANDPTFRSDIYAGILRLFRRRGWKVAADPRILKHHRCLSPDHRIAARSDMRAEVSFSGRHIEITFWSETWPMVNQNGRRYDFDKRAKLAFLERCRVDAETAKILEWVGSRASVSIKTRGQKVEPGGLTAMEFVQQRYAEGWHNDKALGRPVCTQIYNSKSCDEGVVEHDSTVWFADRKGRICRGVALYNINNMWWIITGRYGLENKGSHDIYVRQPADLRSKQNATARQKRLEAELAAAIRRCDFKRAELVKTIAFGASPTYGIWSRKWNTYYAANYCGYTGDAVSAGRYTWAEAVAEVRRVPHILSLVMPDGSHLQAEDLDRREAA